MSIVVSHELRCHETPLHLIGFEELDVRWPAHSKRRFLLIREDIGQSYLPHDLHMIKVTY